VIELELTEPSCPRAQDASACGHLAAAVATKLPDRDDPANFAAAPHALRPDEDRATGLLVAAAAVFRVCVTVGDGHGAWGGCRLRPRRRWSAGWPTGSR